MFRQLFADSLRIRRKSYFILCEAETASHNRMDGASAAPFMRIQMRDSHKLYCEYGDNPDWWIVSHNGSWLEIGTEEFDKFIEDYNTIRYSVKDEIIDNLIFLEIYKEDLDLKSVKIWKNEAMDYIKRHDNEKD